ncbi:MAG TPA: peptidoglycan editing factor PgeF [Sandaracinaceae bacterium LLY-WYZ-13_1]|nr:peptidoglycan editing factor PgeF [Sandaracinaceae bacterium LLY-WYZ-13_1]
MSVALTAPRLSRHGFAHGFSLRTGGASEAPFESLNLGRTMGDDPTRVAENLATFCEAVGCAPDRLFEVSQVHGRTVVDVKETDAVADVRAIEADALVTAVEGAAVGVRTADCLPLLLADPRTGAVAAVHAGWRGAAARVVEEAVERLVGVHGSRAEDLLAAIGPHIRLDAFEVSEDVAARIAESAHGARVVEPREPRPHADLAATVRAQLAHVGVRADRVEDVGGCTHAEPTRFFSHRRDDGRTGRHLSVIVARR